MPSSRRVDLQGPKPQPLNNVARNSHHIKKPAIIYLSSPKIIHARPEDFMSLVQRLTGNNRSTLDSSTGECLEIDSERAVDRTRIDSDPLLLSLGQIPAVPSPVASCFFLCSPSSADACLQEFGLLF